MKAMVALFALAAALPAVAGEPPPSIVRMMAHYRHEPTPPGHHVSCKQIVGVMPSGERWPGVICRVVPDEWSPGERRLGLSPAVRR